MATFSASFSLENWKEKIIALLPSTHCLFLKEREEFSTVKEDQVRLQDYAFTKEFALVQKSFKKKRGVMVLNCSRHHTKERNIRKLTEEEYVRKHTKVAFNNCKYHLRLKKTKKEIWRLVITNSEHNHIFIDPFSFVQHHSRDPDRA